MLPPAASGDVYRAARDGFDLIGLVDARFEAGQTVLHKEILFALAAGVHVWGAGSMGALRAVECAPFGMRGFGVIVAMYRSGEIDGDHEVALQYGPAELGYPPLTEPLVNVRQTLQAAVGAGVLSADVAAALLERAVGTFYKDLTWPRILSDLDRPTADRLREWLPGGRVDQKARDALELAAAMQAALADAPPPFKADFGLAETTHWRRLKATFDTSEFARDAEAAAVLDELRLDPLRYSDMLLRAFARDVAWETGGAPAGDVATHRAELGLPTAAAWRAWLTENRIGEAEVAAALGRDATLDAALDAAAARLAGDIVAALKADGAYAALAARARAKQAALGPSETFAVPPAFAPADLRDLIQWFCRRRGLAPPDEPPDATARGLGLPDGHALHVLLRREFEYTRRMDEGADDTA